MSTKPNILILTVKWGHLSIATGVKDALSENGYESKVIKVDVEKFSDYSYTLVYRYFPKAWKVSFKLSDDRQAIKVIMSYLNNAYKRKISKIIDKEQPDIVINTYFAFNKPLEKLQQKKKFLFINIIENPKTFSKIEISIFAFNMCFGKEGTKKCQTFGIDKSQTIESGWFTRKSFYNGYTKTKYRKQLGLKRQGLVFCVIGGSEGSYNSLKILPAFINTKKTVQVVFICGNNRALLSGVKGFMKILKYQDYIKSEIIPLGFTQNIDEYIKASDLVIGKAGPNLLFESVATKTPFFAISHISGQEDGNLDIIRNYKLGFVEENGSKSIKLLRKIIDNPKILDRFSKPLEQLSAYNRNSGKVLVKLIEENFS